MFTKSLIFSLAFALFCIIVIAHARVATIETASPRAPFVLELPDLNDMRIVAPEAYIPVANLHTLRFRVLNPFAGEIDYGKIYTTINGESAGTIQSSGAGRDGYLITLDLDSKPRFKLQTGKNVIEIYATSQSGKNYYASFLLNATRAGSPLVAAGAKRNPGATFGGLVGIGRNARTAEDAEGSVRAPAFINVESLAAATGDDRTPPEIYLSEPSDVIRGQTTKRTLKIAGSIAEDSDGGVTLTIENRKITLSSAPPAADASVRCATTAPRSFSTTLELDARATEVTLEAADGNGNLTRLTLPVTRPAANNTTNGGTPAGDVAPFKGRKYAVIIGVSDYKFNSYTDRRGSMNRLTDLRYATTDARAVREFLQKPEGGGFAPGDILYLEDSAATLQAVREALTKFLARPRAEDLVFFYFAGHGSPDPNNPQKLYFLMHDTKLSDAARTALPMTELKNTIDNQLQAERVIVFLDACHSAGVTGERMTTLRGEVQENNLINLYAAKLFAGAGRIVLTSSDTSEPSRECTLWGGGHGIFTWALLEGLRGKADANRDRLITAGEVCAYMRRRVQIETAFNQNPRLVTSSNDDFTLAYISTHSTD
ncbi:MAG: caspase family protein [Pyrinomonadaceae bacterium MAG19_C2-C3]|nr:caspase family protein [Pyrinomonadaceae bacterium MAG19_C2-C3]